MQKITNEESFKQILNNKSDFFIMKHNENCPISRGAFQEYEKFLNEHSDDVKGYYLTIQESRDLSNFIEEKFGVKHESPQMFYFSDGTMKWHTSHDNIHYENLEKVITH